MKIGFESKIKGVGINKGMTNSNRNNVTMKIAFTGHRDINPKLVDKSIHKWLVDIKVKYPGAEIIVGGAIGVDAIVAKHAIAIGFNVHIFLPCPVEQFTAKWQDWQVQQLNRQIQHAAEVTVVCKEWHNRCYTRRNEHMAKHADVVIGFYDGRRRGGTKHMMEYSFRAGKRLINGFTRKDWSPGDTPDQPEPQLVESDVEKAEQERTALREIFYTDAEVHGDCYEQILNKVEEIGASQYRCYNESDDFDPKGEAILERHEILTASDEYTLPARIKRALTCDSTLAKDIACWMQVVDPELRMWDYWMAELKSDRINAIKQLQTLYDYLLPMAIDPCDAMEHPELFERPTCNHRSFDDEITEPTYGWHRIDYDDWEESNIVSEVIEERLQTEKREIVSENAKNLICRIKNTEGNDLKRFGKLLYKMQHGKMPINCQLSKDDWTEIWCQYSKRVATQAVLQTETEKKQKQWKPLTLKIQRQEVTPVDFKRPQHPSREFYRRLPGSLFYKKWRQEFISTFKRDPFDVRHLNNELTHRQIEEYKRCL